jgi:hypothetical protein
MPDVTLAGVAATLALIAALFVLDLFVSRPAPDSLSQAGLLDQISARR